MNTDKEVIETLLTALETALEIGAALDKFAQGDRSYEEYANAIDGLAHLKEYADFQRSHLNAETKP